MRIWRAQERPLPEQVEVAGGEPTAIDDGQRVVRRGLAAMDGLRSAAPT
jgi:hypothetical protein